MELARHLEGRDHTDATPPQWLDRKAYPFRHRYLDVDAGRLHYVDEGEGDPVLFVHGTPTWSFEFRHLIRALAEARRCIAPDLIGFGLSSRPQAFPYTPEAHAAVLAQFVDRMRLDRFSLVVHDYGGPIGLPLCLDRSGRVTRLVLMNTWMWTFDDDPAMQRGGRIAGGAVGRFLYKYANASLRLIMPSAYGDRSRLTPEIHRQYLEAFRKPDDRALVLHPLARAILGSRDYYASLWERRGALASLPTLIVWGMKDTAFKPHQLATWEVLLPHAQIVGVESAGHWPHEEEPEQVIEAVRAFVER